MIPWHFLVNFHINCFLLQKISVGPWLLIRRGALLISSTPLTTALHTTFLHREWEMMSYLMANNPYFQYRIVSLRTNGYRIASQFHQTHSDCTCVRIYQCPKKDRAAYAVTLAAHRHKILPTIITTDDGTNWQIQRAKRRNPYKNGTKKIPC